jgi:hypothetical protein
VAPSFAATDNEVDKIADVLRRELTIDEEKSIDKRKEDESFGYSSLHLIARLGEARSELLEYSDYKGMECEIQIRSVLQHAWAEIEHDLGYKGSQPLPAGFKRRFASIAALLEVADREFTHLRDDIAAYQQSFAEAIKGDSHRAEEMRKPIDLISMSLAIDLLPEIKEVEKELGKLGWEHADPPFSFNYLSRQAENLAKCGVGTLDELVEVYRRLRRKIVALGERFMSESGRGLYSRGWSVYLVCLLLAAEKETREETIDLFEKMSIPATGRGNAVLETSRAVVRSEAG